MTPDLFLRTAVVPALGLLPPKMDSAEARALIVSIALQETGLWRRRQMAGGPARSFVQFEPGATAGISGVLQHHATALHAVTLCEVLSIVPTVEAVYTASEYQDVLCAGFARLLLWTSRLPLAGPDDPTAGYHLYLDAWRPGTPRPAPWPSHFRTAWDTVLHGRHQPNVLKA